jgi:phosphatidylinositol alpha-1,6-mannosyltransferase
MRMLALVGDAYGAGGGIAQYNRDAFDALAGVHQIRILPRGGAIGAATPMGVSQDKPIFDQATYAARALAVAFRWKPQAIFCGHLFMAPLAQMLSAVTGARLIIQLHGIEAWRRPTPAIRRAVAAADLVLCVSRDTRARLLSWSPLDPDLAVVLANTVGEAFTPGDRAAARARFGLADQKVILSVGRLDKREAYKGQDRVIDALRNLDAVYLIAGDGDDLPRLQAHAAIAGVTDRVRFLGRVAESDLPDLYRAADVFALPSTGEGFGIVYLEAMACGTPAVGLAAGGAPDALGDGDLGMVVSEADFPAALAELLSKPADSSLAASVRARFGRDVFQSRLRAVLLRPFSSEAVAA